MMRSIVVMAFLEFLNERQMDSIAFTICTMSWQKKAIKWLLCGCVWVRHDFKEHMNWMRAHLSLIYLRQVYSFCLLLLLSFFLYIYRTAVVVCVLISLCPLHLSFTSISDLIIITLTLFHTWHAHSHSLTQHIHFFLSIWNVCNTNRKSKN